MTMKKRRRNRPTQGKIERAMTSEVSVVTEGANGEEFLVKSKDGLQAGELAEGLAKELQKFGIQAEQVEEQDDDSDAEMEDIAKKIAEGFDSLVEAEAQFIEMEKNGAFDHEDDEDEEDLSKASYGGNDKKKRGMNRKTIKSRLGQLAKQIKELMSEVSAAGDAAAAQASGAISERDKKKTSTGTPKAQNESRGGAAMVSPMAKDDDEDGVDEAKDLILGALSPENIAKAITPETLSKALILAGLKPNENPAPAGDAEPTVEAAQKSNDEQDDSELSEEEKLKKMQADLAKDIEEEKRRLADEAVNGVMHKEAPGVDADANANTQEEIAKLRQNVESQQAELQKLKKMSWGSKGLDVHAEPAVQELTAEQKEQEELKKILSDENSVLGQVGAALRARLHVN